MMSTAEDNAAHDQQRSLATEIPGPNHHLVFGKHSSQVSEQDIAQDVGRFSAVSGLSEHVVKSSSTEKAVKPLPSLSSGQLIRSASFSSGDDRSINKGPARANSTGSSIGIPAFPAGEAVKAPRASLFMENFDGADAFEGRNAPTASGRASRNTGTLVDWPLPTPTGSPGPEKESDMRPGLQSGSNAAAMHPQQRATSLVTIVSPEARKSTRTSILPKFLRSKSPEVTRKIGPPLSVRDVQPQSAAKEKAKRHTLMRESGEENISPKSFFDDESSDGDGEDSQIESAQEAMVARQGTVRRVEFKEMLNSTPPIPGSRTMLPTNQTIKGLNQSGGLQGVSLREVHNGKSPGSSKKETSSVDLWNAPDPFAANQHDSKSSILYSSAAIPPKPTRNVSFSSPPPLEVKPQHRFLRQSVISTPYPEDHQGHERKLPSKGRRRSLRPQEIPDQTSIIALVSYGHGGNQPRVKRVAIPASQIITISDESEKGYPIIKAILTQEFDDEKLFKLISKEYSNMCGAFGRVASARGVRSIKLLSYRSTSQLVSKHTKPVHFEVGEAEVVGAETRILKLFRTPRKGRKRHEWTQWIHDQPANAEGADTTEIDKLAIEIIEGWLPGKISVAFGLVSLCSLTAMLLWVFLGKGGNGLALDNAFGAFGQLSEAKIGYRNAGSRVGTGAVLGLFTLLVGWSGLTLWILLSWLAS